MRNTFGTAACLTLLGLMTAACGDVIGPSTYGEPTGIAIVEGAVTVPDTFRVGVPDTVTIALGIGGCQRFLEVVTVELGVHERLLTPWFETDMNATVCQDELVFEPHRVEVVFYSAGSATVYVRGMQTGDHGVRDFDFGTIVIP